MDNLQFIIEGITIGILISISIYIVIFYRNSKTRTNQKHMLEEKRMLVIYTRDYKIVDIVNANPHLLLGIDTKTLGAVTGWETFKYIMNENKQSHADIISVLRYVFKTGKDRYLEYKAVSPIDGKTRFAHCYMSMQGDLLYSSIREVDEDKLYMSRNEFSLRELNLALKSSGQSIWQYNIKNKKLKTLYGNLKIDENMTLQNILDNIVNDPNMVMRNNLMKVINGQSEETNGTIQIQTSYREGFSYIKVHVSLVRNKIGEPETLIGTFIDNTEQVINEQNSSMVIQSILQSSKMRMCYIMSDTGKIFIDDIDGFKDTGLTMDMYKKSVTDEDRDFFCKAMDDLQSGKIKAMDITFTRNSIYYNERNHYRLYVHGDKDATGKVYRLVGLEVNIDNEKKLEHTAIEAEKKQRRLLQLNKMIMDNVNCELLFLDKNKNIVWENDLTGQNTGMKKSFHNECKCYNLNDCNTCAITKCFFSKKIENTKYNHKNRTYEIYAIPIFDNNVFVGVVARSEDITEKEKTLSELREAKRKAEESDNLKSAFLANMSHEIRTPLNAIVGFSNILCSDDNIPAKEKASFKQIINSNNELLLRLINDILDLSKIESGNTNIQPKEVNLNKLLTSQISNFIKRVNDEHRDVDMICHLPEEGLVVYQDANRMMQLMMNLLSNAFKHTMHGSIITSLKTDGDYFIFSVKDTGNGINVSDQSKLFKRFSKLNSFVQGNGLGLAICKAIVDTCGGTIGCESEGEGKGSTFWFRLPIKYSEKV